MVFLQNSELEESARSLFLPACLEQEKLLQLFWGGGEGISIPSQSSPIFLEFIQKNSPHKLVNTIINLGSQDRIKCWHFKKWINCKVYNPLHKGYIVN